MKEAESCFYLLVNIYKENILNIYQHDSLIIITGQLLIGN